MGSFSLSKRAVSDLMGIGRYTEQNWGKKQRDTYLAQIDACFHQVAADPRLGRDCSEIREDYRKIGVGSHVVFYRQQAGDTIEIVRILHGRMDFATRLASR
jgi:toxin ParE1/3/4